MTTPEIAFDFSKAIELIERDESSEGGVVACWEDVEVVIILRNIAPNLTMGTLEGYVLPEGQALDEPAP